MRSGTPFWGGGFFKSGAFAPDLKNSDYFVFLPTKFCFFNISPPLGSR